MGAETSGHWVSTVRSAGDVLPESSDIQTSARVDHASMASRWHIAVQCAGGVIADCRVIEVLGDHANHAHAGQLIEVAG